MESTQLVYCIKNIIIVLCAKALEWHSNNSANLLSIRLISSMEKQKRFYCEYVENRLHSRARFSPTMLISVILHFVCYWYKLQEHGGKLYTKYVNKHAIFSFLFSIRVLASYVLLFAVLFNSFIFAVIFHYFSLCFSPFIFPYAIWQIQYMKFCSCRTWLCVKEFTIIIIMSAHPNSRPFIYSIERNMKL